MAIDGNDFVQSPGTRAMIEDDIAYGIAAQCIVAVIDVGRASAEAHMANDNVVGVDFEGFAGNADAVARRALSGYGQVRSPNVYGRFQMNNAGHVEYNDAGSALFTGPTKRAFARVV